MRQFKIRNSLGQEIGLQDKQGYAFFDEEGLGFDIDASFQRIGDQFRLIEKGISQPQVSGNLVINGYDAYAKYTAFVAFCSYTPLVLIYEADQTLYLEGMVISLQKGDMINRRTLVCPMVFVGTSYWYDDVLAEEAAGSLPDSTKMYTYTYPYQYASGENGTVELVNGALNSYFKITIFGPATNPKWQLYSGGVLTNSGKILATIPEGNKLIVNSDPLEMEITEYTNSGTFVVDRYPDSDFTTERIFSIPPGTCKMLFSDDSVTAPVAWIEVKKRV